MCDPTVDDLRMRWNTLGIDAPVLRDALLTAYAEPHRHYHDIQHLYAVLTHIDALAREADDARAVRLAAWFHDAVYDVHAQHNEQRSACWAETALLKAGLSSAAVREVARLVRLTANHDPGPSDANGAALCDADLAVLASEPTIYDAYAVAVRREYAHVPDSDFRRGRARVLEQLLGLPVLFRTAHGRSQWEAAARANVTRELVTLTG